MSSVQEDLELEKLPSEIIIVIGRACDHPTLVSLLHTSSPIKELLLPSVCFHLPSSAHSPPVS
jgi:hypothetical protein